MSGKEGISNESDKNLVQRFSAKQIQQLARAIYSLNNNGRSDTFVSSAGLLAHNSSSNYAFTKPWILDSGATHHIAYIHNFSHTLHHHLFQMLICPQAQLRPSHLQAQLNLMTKSLSKMFFGFLLLIFKSHVH